jgi:hypothetical protein
MTETTNLLVINNVDTRRFKLDGLQYQPGTLNVNGSSKTDRNAGSNIERIITNPLQVEVLELTMKIAQR